MTNKTIKKLVYDFINKHHLMSADYFTLAKVIERLGYTIIYFNSVLNNTDVEIIIQNLKLKDVVPKSRGFTYTDENYRLVFINENLTEDEKLIVISHELGHIVCGHFDTAPIIGNDVIEENEANEFSHYLLEQSPSCKIRCLIQKYKKLIIYGVSILIILLASIVIILVCAKEESYFGNYYITPTGEKYHEPECVHIKYHKNAQRLTKEQFKSGEYGPCGTCLPE